jgi:hypothetical protein
VISYLRRISDERYRRAQRRRRAEEIMGWICVPLIILVGWYAWKGWEQMVAERQPQLRDVAVPASIGAPPSRP